MATLHRYGWTKRTGLVIMLLLVFTSTSTSLRGRSKAYASPCCEWNIITLYYSDASHTTQVGRCVDSDCTGYSCTGEQTEFSTQLVTCCAHCGGGA